MTQPSIHPLDLLHRIRTWLPGSSPWRRDRQTLRPEPEQDWLLEPANREDAVQFFPQLDEEAALLKYQRLKLQLREREGRGF